MRKLLPPTCYSVVGKGEEQKGGAAGEGETEQGRGQLTRQEDRGLCIQQNNSQPLASKRKKKLNSKRPQWDTLLCRSPLPHPTRPKLREPPAQERFGKSTRRPRSFATLCHSLSWQPTCGPEVLQGLFELLTLSFARMVGVLFTWLPERSKGWLLQLQGEPSRSTGERGRGRTVGNNTRCTRSHPAPDNIW